MSKKIKIRLSEYIEDLHKLRDALIESAKELGKDQDPDIFIEMHREDIYDRFFNINIKLKEKELDEYYKKTGKIPPGIQLVLDLTNYAGNEKLQNDADKLYEMIEVAKEDKKPFYTEQYQQDVAELLGYENIGESDLTITDEGDKVVRARTIKNGEDTISYDSNGKIYTSK
jgi:hypothetical protein